MGYDASRSRPQLLRIALQHGRLQGHLGVALL